MTDYQEILNSHFNGQHKQTKEQIDEHPIADFLDKLEEDDTLSYLERFEILKYYLRVK